MTRVHFVLDNQVTSCVQNSILELLKVEQLFMQLEKKAIEKIRKVRRRSEIILALFFFLCVRTSV